MQRSNRMLEQLISFVILHIVVPSAMYGPFDKTLLLTLSIIITRMMTLMGRSHMRVNTKMRISE